MASSQQDLDECVSLRSDEIDVVQSIYEGHIAVHNINNNALKIDLEMAIDLEGEWQLDILDDGSSKPPRNKDSTSPMPIPLVKAQQPARISINHLPPILLSLVLPPTYPLHLPPTIRSLRAAQSWLTPPLLARLRTIIDDFMREKLDLQEGVLFSLLEFVREGEVLEKLGLLPTGALIDRKLRLPHPTPQLLAPLLLSHSTKAATTQFNGGSYPCPICLTTVKGSQCILLETCGHVCCRPCLTEFWATTIQQGEVERVGCVDPKCVERAAKSNDPLWSSVSEEEVRRVVGEGLTQRWISLREKRMFDRDPTVVRCPVPLCQAPVPKPPPTSAEEEDDGWSRLRQCPSCGFVFCLACRRTWHGPITACKLSLTSTFLETYMNAAPGSMERTQLERQYGKKNLERMVKTYVEAKANAEWLSENAMQCPGCRAQVEKSMGCNHMKCARCSIHFCFLCGQKLPADNPYYHFSNRQNAKCFGNLFAYHGFDEGAEEELGRWAWAPGGVDDDDD